MRSEDEIRERIERWEDNQRQGVEPLKSTAKVVELEWVLDE